MADQKTNEEVMTAVTELRTEVEKKGFIDKDRVERLNVVLDGYEDKNQQITLVEQQAKSLEADIKEIKKLREEEAEANTEGAKKLKEQITDMEAEIARGVERKHAGDENSHRLTEEYKSLNLYCKEGERVLFQEEHKVLLRTDSATEGGILVPTELDNVITKKIVEIDPIRTIARVRTIGGKSMELAIRAAIPIATYEGEADSGDDSTSTYESETVTPFRQTHTTPITKDMLMDSAFDMDAEIAFDSAEAFAFGEGNGFVVGTGFKVPAGFMVDTRIIANRRITTAAAAITGFVFEDDLIRLSGDLKVGYDPVYVMNRRTLSEIRTLKSTTGQFLWMPGLSGPVANTLNGFPYTLANSMPDAGGAASSRSVAFGDFRRGYVIVDRTGMSVVRDEITQKKKAIVEFTMNRWNTGLVALPEAITILENKA
jgi:HK97 family phage major capsid protein